MRLAHARVRWLRNGAGPRRTAAAGAVTSTADGSRLPMPNTIRRQMPRPLRPSWLYLLHAIHELLS